MKKIYYAQYADDYEKAIDVLNRDIEEKINYNHEIVDITVIRCEQPINRERTYITVRWTLKEVE